MNPARIGWAACLAAAVAGCGLPGAAERATVTHFERNRAAYDSLAAAASRGAAADSLATAYAWLAAAPAAGAQPARPGLGVEVLADPLHVQVTPVDFYWVLVWVGDGAALARSDAMRDEGASRRSLGAGWHLVRRGFM